MSKPIILIVEDDQWMVEQHKLTLESTGVIFDCATTAQEAIDKIDLNRPSVIILDILLDGQTGFALLNELRSHSDIGQIPVVICSNLSVDFNLNDLKNYGVKFVLDKTVMQPEDLLAVVREILDEC